MANKMIEITCPECEGEGIVWVLDWLYYDGSHDEHEEICDECNGEGSLIVDAEDYYSDHPEEAPEGFWEEEETKGVDWSKVPEVMSLDEIPLFRNTFDD